MIRLIFLTLQVRFTLMANRLIHFFRLHRAYGSSELKMFIVILGALFVINRKTLFHFMYMVILAVLGIALNLSHVHGGITQVFAAESPFAALQISGVFENIFVIWFIISIIGAPLQAVIINGTNHTNDNMMVNYLRANFAIYAKSRILADIFGGILLYIPFFVIVFAFLAESAAVLIIATVTSLIMFVAARLTGEAVNLWMFKRFGTHLGRMLISTVFVIPVYAASIIVPYFFGMPNLMNITTGLFALMLSIIFGVFSFLYMKKYPLYMKILRDRINYYEIMYTDARKKSDALTANVDVANWSKGLEKENFETDKHASKKGFDYLNAIFFDRHKKYFTKKILVRCSLLALPLAAAVVLAAFSFITTGAPPVNLLRNTNPDSQFLSINGLLRYTSAILFIIYVVSMGRVVTASVFSNCDIQMLNYTYYRRAKTILSSFKARFAEILRFNFIITSVAFLSTVGTLALIFGYLNWISVFVFFIALSFTGLFFAFNDLFLYYIIQPYDIEGKDKSIPNKIINWIIYLVSWLSFFSFQISLVPYTIAIVIAAAVYLGVGVVLLVKIAPGRFRLR